MSLTVEQLLREKKEQRLYTVQPDQTTYDALKIMADNNIGCVAVMENDRLIGLLTERDYARRIVLEGKKSRSTPVRETMNPTYYAVAPSTNLEQCLQYMTQHRARYLPVMEVDRLIGLLSIGDVIKTLLSLSQSNVELLERFVSGKEYGF